MRARRGLALAAVLAGLPLLGAIIAPWVAPFDPFSITGPSFAVPSAPHWLGTDALGRDVWSRVLWGARTSWLVGATVGLITTPIAIMVGITAARSGGWKESVLMGLTDMVLVLPRFFLVILVVALLGPGLDRIVVVLAATSWAGMARIVRAETISIQERDFVRFAEASGATHWQVAVGEIMPNVLPTVLVLVGLLVGRVILVEASLSFLGLGDPTVTSWGAMAGEANATLRVAWWPAAAPGLAIVSTVLGLNLLGDAVAGETRVG
jgi:peptide/nickel transport system permease protein